MRQDESKNIGDASKIRLVLAPHMDDEVIGMGGTIAYLSDNGFEVYVAYLTDGGGNYSGAERRRYVETRKGEARRCSRILGVKDSFFLDYPDASLYKYMYDAVENLVGIILRLGVTVIYAPHANEYHVDHRAANEIARIAAWRLAYLHGHAIHYIYEYETWPPMAGFTDIVDITGCVEAKRKALQVVAEGSQKYLDPDSVLALNRY
jgi:LmbE family N-acetylglucosaminyl deacetylase